MDVFAEYATDETKENEGVWSKVGDKGELLIGRAGNKKYSAMLSRQVEKNQRTLDLKTEAADELSNEIIVDVMANSILLGWKNIEFKGKALEYSVENAKMLLRVKDFRKLVSERAADFDAYRTKAEAAQGEGSQPA